MQLSFTTKRPYRFLWLMQVTGFNPKEHCLKCLEGKRSKLIPPARKNIWYPAGYTITGTLNPSIAPYAYLCGVADTYQNNLHIAFKFGSGEIQLDNDAIALTITWATQIEIHPLTEPLQARLPKAFSTCRNYQFGAQTFGLSDHFSLSDALPTRSPECCDHNGTPFGRRGCQ